MRDGPSDQLTDGQEGSIASKNQGLTLPNMYLLETAWAVQTDILSLLGWRPVPENLLMR